MLRYASTARVEFEASHFVPDHSMCGHGHGHKWAIEVTVDGGLDPKKIQVIDHGALLSDLLALITIFASRDLNDMLEGVVTTPEGLAMYVREQLILEWPRITHVNVEMGPFVSVVVESEVR